MQFKYKVNKYKNESYPQKINELTFYTVKIP